MISLSDPEYPKALAWFQNNGFDIKYNLNHATKKLDLTLYHGERKLKDKSIPYDNNLVIETQQSILNLYRHYNKEK